MVELLAAECGAHAALTVLLRRGRLTIDVARCLTHKIKVPDRRLPHGSGQQPPRRQSTLSRLILLAIEAMISLPMG
jgi:hypothetical protein